MRIDEKRISFTRIYSGKIVNLRVDKIMLPNDEEAEREIVEHPGAVAVVPVLDNDSICFVRQYRTAIEKEMLEIPAGTLKPKEDPRDCAVRELEEETGLETVNITHLFTLYTTPGFCDEILHVYIARTFNQKEQNLDRDEFLEVEKVSVKTVQEMLRNGEINDAKTLIGLLGFFQLNTLGGE